MKTKTPMRQCPDCKSVTETTSPYCEACGCQFSSKTKFTPPGKVWMYRAIAVVTGAGVGFLYRLLLG
jgi:predicted amidophosphoribosyltransferase